MIAISTALTTIGLAIGLPVLMATLTTSATTLVTRISAAADRRRDRYAHSVKTLVAWIEFAYRVRRRPDDTPSTLSALTALGHDIQENLAFDEAWIRSDSEHVAAAYDEARSRIEELVAPAVKEAWDSPPAATAADMNLNGWGPGADCRAATQDLQRAIERRFRPRWRR